MSELEYNHNLNPEINNDKKEAEELLCELWPKIVAMISPDLEFFSGKQEDVDKRGKMINCFRKALDRNLLEDYKVDMMTADQSKEYNIIAEKLYDLAIEENRLPKDLCFKK